MTVTSLRRLNSWEWAGDYERSSESLDALVIEHLDTQRALERLDAYQELVLRMTVEGYSRREIAAEAGCSRRKVERIAAEMRGELRAMAVDYALRKAA